MLAKMIYEAATDCALILALSIGHALDVATTLYVLEVLHGVELNPLVAPFVRNPVYVFAVKSVAVSAIVRESYRLASPRRALLWSCAICYFAVIWNGFVIFRKTRRKNA